LALACPGTGGRVVLLRKTDDGSLGKMKPALPIATSPIAYRLRIYQ
jgi:hypothetical protein